MNNFAKGRWTTDSDTVHLSMPIAKVDEAKRTVSGFATLDNVDSQGDVVTAEASTNAFARARGNLREMHQPLAVGKVVDFREDEFYDPSANDGQGGFYRGIFVTARVSLGAEDTWHKVLDGTLSGFSIGGEINEATNEFVKESGRTVRFITDYDLSELSLVDNPANQLANVFSIQKSASGSLTVKGMAVDTVIENVFFCTKDNEIKSQPEEESTCLECGEKMENIGWFEVGEDRAEKVRGIVSKFLSPAVEEAAPDDADSEGGVDMGTKKDVTKSETPVEEVAEPTETNTDEPAEETEEVNETAGTEEEPEETASPEEVTDDETEISKKIDELKETVNSSLEKTRDETKEQVASLEKKIEEINESFEKKASELEGRFEEFGNKLEAAKSKLSEFEKSLDTINASEAVKKSADYESEEPVQKSKDTTWNGAFSGKKFSVNNLL